MQQLHYIIFFSGSQSSRNGSDCMLLVSARLRFIFNFCLCGSRRVFWQYYFMLISECFRNYYCRTSVLELNRIRVYFQEKCHYPTTFICQPNRCRYRCQCIHVAVSQQAWQIQPSTSPCMHYLPSYISVRTGY